MEQQQQQQQVINEITIKGEKLKNLMLYIDVPHKIGKELEGFIQNIARENLEEKQAQIKKDQEPEEILKTPVISIERPK